MINPDCQTKLLDFGIARSNEEATITNANAVIGTPSYMAPEQVRGEPAAFATDLWSLGVLGYEMFAGHQPFAGQIVANVLYQVMNKAPAPAPHLPKAMQKVLRRALDKDPARRYASAGDFVRAVRAALPKSALAEPDLAASKPNLLIPKLPALKIPAVPRWMQGVALLLLFGGGFGYAFQHRHQETRPLGSHSAVAEHRALPAVLPGPAPVPVMLLPPVRTIPATTAQSGASLPQPRQADAVLPAQPPTVAAEKVAAEKSTEPELRHPAVSETRKEASAPAQNAASMTVRQDSVPPAPEKTAPAQNAVPAQDTEQVQGTEQAQGAGQAQSAVQAALPVSGSAYDPEAEARLRKSEWSQSDAGAAR